VQRKLVKNVCVRKFNFLASIYRVFRFSPYYSNVYKSELASCLYLAAEFTFATNVSFLLIHKQ